MYHGHGAAAAGIRTLGLTAWSRGSPVSSAAAGSWQVHAPAGGAARSRAGAVALQDELGGCNDRVEVLPDVNTDNRSRDRVSLSGRQSGTRYAQSNINQVIHTRVISTSF